jgi:UPF0755 protein
MPRLKHLLVCSLAVATVAIGCGAGFAWWRIVIRQPGPLPETRAIVIPRGSTAGLATSLVAEGLIAYPDVFRAAAWLSRDDGPLRAAELAFPAHASIERVLAILRAGRPVEHHVTVPEGLTARQIQAILAHAEAATGIVPPIEEGSVLPQTYDYQYGAERRAIAARAEAGMNKALAAAWASRSPDLPLGSPRDALILASIVERETAKPDERPHVAAVYLNRLRLGMKLQADPTVAYLVSGGAGVLDHPLTKAELARDDPFNTYRSTGLPPAPICSPSVASLIAVTHPARTDDLFFVADGTGGHVFSRGLDAHDAAVAHWRSLTPSTSHGSSD